MLLSVTGEYYNFVGCFDNYIDATCEIADRWVLFLHNALPLIYYHIKINVLLQWRMIFAENSLKIGL